MHDVLKLASMENKLIDIVECELAKPYADICTEELGEVIDMIKDLADAKKNCRMEHYYHLVSEAMDPENQRMGYTPTPSHIKPWRMMEDFERSEYPEYSEYAKHSKHPESRRGVTYDRYHDARRHYTSTMKPQDKQEMDAQATEYLKETLEAMEDIWDAADPTLRQDMKTKLTNFVNNMA